MIPVENTEANLVGKQASVDSQGNLIQLLDGLSTAGMSVGGLVPKRQPRA